MEDLQALPHFNELLNTQQYSLPQVEKESLLLGGLNALTAAHRDRCPEYARLLRGTGAKFQAKGISEAPYVPVSLFKTHRLKSIPDSEVFRVLRSSGTTSQRPSLITLDRETARRQTVALGSIMKHLFGGRRLPMLFIDSRQVLSNRTEFSARTAAVLGMMNFGRDHVFCLTENMELDHTAIDQFLTAHRGSDVIVFGFTALIWKHLVLHCAPGQYDLSRATLVHGGGWKKLVDVSVSNAVFKAKLREHTGMTRVHNYYGLIEQVGSVFVEACDGYLYAPNFADIVIRNQDTWEEARIGETGIVQVLSLVPLSYPGHSILTEDLGVMHGIDDGPSGRKGKYFSIIGRIPNSEIRGCSDAVAA